LLPDHAGVLDIGCGDGLIDKLIMEQKQGVNITGCDVVPRTSNFIDVIQYNGTTLPFANKEFDYSLLIDVVHHADNPPALLKEAARVARSGIIIKDHLADRLLAIPILRLMDWIGNERFKVALPYTYWKRRKWQEQFRELGLKLENIDERIPLYPPWADWLFGYRLHFIALLIQNW